MTKVYSEGWTDLPSSRSRVNDGNEWEKATIASYFVTNQFGPPSPRRSKVSDDDDDDDDDGDSDDDSDASKSLQQ